MGMLGYIGLGAAAGGATAANTSLQSSQQAQQTMDLMKAKEQADTEREQAMMTYAQNLQNTQRGMLASKFAEAQKQVVGQQASAAANQFYGNTGSDNLMPSDLSPEENAQFAPSPTDRDVITQAGLQTGLVSPDIAVQQAGRIEIAQLHWETIANNAQLKLDMANNAKDVNFAIAQLVQGAKQDTNLRSATMTMLSNNVNSLEKELADNYAIIKNPGTDPAIQKSAQDSIKTVQGRLEKYRLAEYQFAQQAGVSLPALNNVEPAYPDGTQLIGKDNKSYTVNNGIPVLDNAPSPAAGNPAASPASSPVAGNLPIAPRPSSSYPNTQEGYNAQQSAKAAAVSAKNDAISMASQFIAKSNRGAISYADVGIAQQALQAEHSSPGTLTAAQINQANQVVQNGR